MSVIETHALTKVYGPTRAVDGLDIAVERGQVFGFLGPNGSGKTTTIGMLLGIITPTSGSYRLLGAESRAEREAARLRVGATLEQPNFYPYLTCRDNLVLVARVKRVAKRQIDEVLDVVGLASRQKTRFGACSLGMKQRLALAATMLGDPELLILDEPANGLDPEGMREIREIIGRMAERGTTIFLSSHLLWEVERVCSHVAILRKGTVVRQGPVSELTGGRTVAVLAADDTEMLAAQVRAYPGSVRVDADGDRVRVQLKEADLASLNRWLGARNIHLSHLTLEQRSLEDAFMESTGASVAGMGVIE
jgi:ABC-type multidrug transport system ATPase subunit